MTALNQKKLLVVFGVLLLAGFLFSIPKEAFAINFTSGWYRDNGTTDDVSCGAGYWRAYVELKDYEENTLLVDTLRIQAIFYPEPAGDNPGIGYVVYDSGELTNLDSFETPCEIEMKEGTGKMVLDIEASKGGYYAMKARNNVRWGGEGLNQRKWSKTLYLVPTDIGEWPDANIAYIFPDNDQWISGREEDSEMRLWVNRVPLLDNITEIKIEIIHHGTGQRFLLTQTTNTAEGEIIFSLPALAEQGGYIWRIISMKSTPSVFYNEKLGSVFYFDSLTPLLDLRYDHDLQDGEEQAPSIAAAFYDNLPPASGVDKIELYLDDGYGGDIGLVHTCFYDKHPYAAVCSYKGEYEIYDESRTYNWYAIAYDYVGNKKEIAVESFTIDPLEPSRLLIRSKLALDPVTGVPFEIIDIIPDNPEGAAVPEVGEYQTNETFLGYQDYEYTIEAPDSYNGVPFSFWERGLTAYNDQQMSSAIWLDTIRTLRMYFGVSKLQIWRRQLTNKGVMTPDLDAYIDKITTRIEQIEGTPSDLLGPDGYVDFIYGTRYSKKVVEEIKDIVLRINASEDGILQPAGLKYSDFCEPDPEGSQEQCKGSINYISGKVTPYFSIQRTVRVESYLGSDPNPENAIEGLEITATGDVQGGTTNAEGYYTFSSTDRPEEFVGTLWAPPSITDLDDNVVEFGGWSCGNVSADKLGCYIEDETWYNDVAVVAIAYYGGEPDSALPELAVNIKGNGTVTSGLLEINCVGPDNTGDCSAYFGEESEVNLTANIPGPEYYFVGWSDIEDWDDCESFGDNPVCELTMDSDKQVRAEFALITYDLTINSTAGGSTNPVEGTHNYEIHTHVPLVATADPGYDPGYRFVNWTGSDVSTIADVNSAITTITMEDNYTITANFEEVIIRADSVQGNHGDYCFANSAPIHLSWQFFSNIGTDQSAYQVQFSTDPGFGSFEDSGVVSSNHDEYTPAVALSFGTDYYWQVKVWDDDIPPNESAWFPDPPPLLFSTRSEYPWPRFNWSPSIPIVNEPAQFCSMFEAGLCETAPTGGLWSSCPSGFCSYSWTFENGTSPDDTAQNPEATFSSIVSGGNEVRLTMADGAHSCTETLNVIITLPLPEYREVPPVSRVDSFLARLGDIFRF